MTIGTTANEDLDAQRELSRAAKRIATLEAALEAALEALSALPCACCRELAERALVAAQFGVDPSNISCIVNRRTWRHI